MHAWRSNGMEVWHGTTYDDGRIDSVRTKLGAAPNPANAVHTRTRVHRQLRSPWQFIAGRGRDEHEAAAGRQPPTTSLIPSAFSAEMTGGGVPSVPLHSTVERHPSVVHSQEQDPNGVLCPTIIP